MALSRCGSGSQTAPICCQPGVMLSMMRRATIEVAARVVVAERQAELVIAQRGGRADGRRDGAGKDLRHWLRNVSSVRITSGQRYCWST